MDRIDERDGGWWSSTTRPAGTRLTVDDARGSTALALYALAARRTLRRPCTRVELHHLPTGAVLAWEHTEESLARHLGRVEEAADELQLATDTLAAGGDPELLFPPRPGPRCGWCDLRRSCPDGQAAAPERASWSMLEPE